MSLYFGSIGSFINMVTTVLLVISIIIGLYLVYIWKKFNEDVYRRVQGTPAEIHFMRITPTHYLLSQIIIIAILIMSLNIIGALICWIATPYLQKMSLEKLGLNTTYADQLKTHEVRFDD